MPAEESDGENDRDWNTDQPQESGTHLYTHLLASTDKPLATANVPSNMEPRPPGAMTKAQYLLCSMKPARALIEECHD